MTVTFDISLIKHLSTVSVDFKGISGDFIQVQNGVNIPSVPASLEHP